MPLPHYLHKFKHEKEDTMTYDDKELEILRKAVDVVEARKGKETMRDPEVKKIIETVEHFISEKKLVCYGGTAINNILPEDAQFYNKDIELPDYDFYSDKALEHAKELADIYYKAGYEDVEAKAGVHFGTYKVFVNFTGIADITQMEPELFKAISKEAVIKNNIRYAPPNFLRMAMYLELSRPDGDVSRWEKVQKRLVLLNKHYPLKGYDCDKIQFQRGFEEVSGEEAGIVDESKSNNDSKSSNTPTNIKKKSGGGGGVSGLINDDSELREKAISQIKQSYSNLGDYMKFLYRKNGKSEEIDNYKYKLEKDHKHYDLIVEYNSLLTKKKFNIYSLPINKITDSDSDNRPVDSLSLSKTKSKSNSSNNNSKSTSTKSSSHSRSQSNSPSKTIASHSLSSKEKTTTNEKTEYTVDVARLSYDTEKELLLHQTDVYNIVRNVFIKHKVVFFGGYANILYSRYMPKHQRRLIQKIPDFDVLSEDPRVVCEDIVSELILHNYKKVKYVKHKGVGEVISEHFDIRIGDEVVAFVYKPLACHSYNTLRIENENIRIATIDTMLSFYLAFIYANRPYYDQNRIVCMSQFLFDVQQHNRLKQTGLLKRFSIDCYGKQDTLESMRFEKTTKYEELKNKKDSKEYEQWFLRYIPLETAKNRKDRAAKQKTSKKPKSTKTNKTKKNNKK